MVLCKSGYDSIVTYFILPFSSLNLGRMILTEVDSSDMINLFMVTIKLLTGSGPEEKHQFNHTDHQFLKSSPTKTK